MYIIELDFLGTLCTEDPGRYTHTVIQFLYCCVLPSRSTTRGGGYSDSDEGCSWKLHHPHLHSQQKQPHGQLHLQMGAQQLYHSQRK